MNELTHLTIKEARDGLLKKTFSAEELLETHRAKAEVENPKLNAYLELFDEARDEARAADKRLAIEKNASPVLTGIPLAIKDNMLIEGRKVSCASKILEGYRASYDATVIKKLKQQNAVFIGRTNMDEFAMGSSTETSAYARTRNPHDTERVPGGSSGGSAAAVAGEIATAAIGSDTGGSIRQPASLCGVVGFKPTYGAVSRSGLIAMASSLDQIGPFARTVADAKILFDAIRGIDPMDSTTHAQEHFVEKERKIIGAPYHWFEASRDGIDPDVYENFETTLKKLQERGYDVRPIRLEKTPFSLAVYYILMTAEASTNLARFDGMRYGLSVSGDDLLGDYSATRGSGFGREVRRRILLGTHVLSSGYYDAYYGKGVATRDNIRREMEEVFRTVDFIATPTAPAPAFRFGEKSDNPMSMYLSDIFTVSANIAGIPGISVPSGTVLREGKALPVGFQLMAAARHDDALFGVAGDIEQSVM